MKNSRSTTSQVVGVADVELGYGSPQISLFLSSLADHYGTTALAFETDLLTPPQAWRKPDNLYVEKVPTTVHPHQAAGIAEYNARVTERINTLRPAVLCIFNSNNIGILSRLAYRPKLVVYYMLEMPFPEWREANLFNARFVDLFVFPEENRARLFVEENRVRDKAVTVLYNASLDLAQATARPWGRRNAKVVYAGTIGRQTLAHYYLTERLDFCEVDLFGRVGGEDALALEDQLVGAVGRVRYHGLIPREELEGRLPGYAYSVCMWNPDVPNQRYACPNKFFDSIAQGVPVVGAPHPQVKSLLERYKCGVLMEDWSFKAFLDALRYAMQVFGTHVYEEMVANTRTAFEAELNWSVQFAKVLPFLPKGIMK